VTRGRGRQLSELEGCVLGHLWKHGPSTAYAVRQELLVSPSSHWSASAGAIYPLLQRLELQRLVTAREATRGDRDASAYALTPLGTQQFLRWLGPPFESDVVSIAVDPLRTRVHFLGAMPPRRRTKYLQAAIHELKRHLGELSAFRRTGDAFDRLSLAGALRLTRARIAWLAQVQGALGRLESK